MDARSFHTPLAHLDATAVLEALAQPLLILDADCCVAYANRASLRLLAVEMPALQGRPLHHLFLDGPGLALRLRQLLDEAAEASGTLRTTVTELARPDRPLRLQALAVDDEMSGPHLVVQLKRQRVRRAPTPRVPRLTLVGPHREQRECA